MWGGAHLPKDRFAPPLRIFASFLKSHAPLLGKVSMIDQSGNLTFFGSLVEVCRSDWIRSDFGTKIYISDRIDKVVS
jgi:hypothetical protein